LDFYSARESEETEKIILRTQHLALQVLLLKEIKKIKFNLTIKGSRKRIKSRKLNRKRRGRTRKTSGRRV